MKKTATIILNRNLPEETNALVEHLMKHDGDHTDIFVVEAGSDKDKLSKYCTWHVTTAEAVKHGLRYSRGMNYGLLQLWKEGNWDKYDSFFLLTKDTKFPKNQTTVGTLQKLLEDYPKVGVLSPCSDRWGEKDLIGANSLISSPFNSIVPSVTSYSSLPAIMLASVVFPAPFGPIIA